MTILHRRPQRCAGCVLVAGASGYFLHFARPGSRTLVLRLAKPLGGPERHQRPRPHAARRVSEFAPKIGTAPLR